MAKANGKRSTIKRTPRTSGGASACYSIMPDGEVSVFTPKPQPLKRRSIVALDNGELILRISDL